MDLKESYPRVPSKGQQKKVSPRTSTVETESGLSPKNKRGMSGLKGGGQNGSGSQGETGATEGKKHLKMG